MKNTFIVLLMTLSLSAWATKNGLPIQEFKRTFVNLRNMDLSECAENYRFINDNWMDCEFKLPGDNQIVPARYPILNFTIEVNMGDITGYVDIRSQARTFEEASLGTNLWVSAYYQKKNILGIQTLPRKFYSPAVLISWIKKAFEMTDADGSMTSMMMGVPNTKQSNTMTIDTPIQEVFVGVRNITPKLEDCAKTYAVILNDNWPDEGFPSSSCMVKEGKPRSNIPLSEDYWSSRLTAYKISKAIPVDSTPGASVLFQFLSGHYTIFAGENNEYDVSVPFTTSEAWIKEALAKLGTHQIIFMVKKDELKSLDKNESVLGRMVLKKDKIDVEKISKL